MVAPAAERGRAVRLRSRAWILQSPTESYEPVAAQPATKEEAEMAQMASAYPCPTCGSKNTTATYYHTCIKRFWFVEKCPAPGPGKGPEPVSCPDGLVECSNTNTRRDSLPARCSGTGRVEASQLRCLDCKTTIVYPPTPTRRRVKRHAARK